jgi:hypothetical protein
MPIFKLQGNSHYAKIPNSTLRDKRLSIEARGTLTYLLTHSDTFELSFEFLQKELGVGRDKMNKIARELKENGYLELRAAHNKKGKFSGQEWFVFAESQNENLCLTNNNRPTEKPSDVKTVRRENRQTENTYDNIKEKLRQKEKNKEENKRVEENAPTPKKEKVVGNLRGIPVQEIIGDETDDESEFFREVVDGLKTRLNTPTRLPNERKWLESVEWSWQNRFPPEQTLEVFDLLEKIRKKKKAVWSVSPELWQSSIPKIESLRIELENLEQNGAATNAITKQTNFQTTADRRDERAIAEFQLTESIRARLNSGGNV